MDSVVGELYGEEDRDGDGVPNLLETAFGSDLNDGSSSPEMNGPEVVPGEEGEPDTLRYHYLRVAGGTEESASYQAGALRYFGETSKDLKTWTSEAVTQVEVDSEDPALPEAPTGYEWGALELTMPAESSGAYLRIRVRYEPAEPSP